MPVHNPLEKMGSLLCQWGAGHDAVNVVGTNFLAGYEVDNGTIKRAVSMLEGYLTLRKKQAVGKLQKEEVKECSDFQKLNRVALEGAGDPSQNGHDFFLTRNGHGAGFWGRGYGEVGDRLSAACKSYGSQDLYLGDDGKIHCS
jgi:hypothetical protein